MDELCLFDGAMINAFDAVDCADEETIEICCDLNAALANIHSDAGEDGMS